MKKILSAIAVFGFMSMQGVYSQDESVKPVYNKTFNDAALYETIEIPSFSQIPVIPAEGINVDENTDLNTYNGKVNQTQNYTNTNNKKNQKSIEGNIYEPIMNMIGSYKNEIKIIYSDIDGIIVPEGSKNIIYNDKLYNSFIKLKENDIPIVFTTNRTYREAKRFAKQIGIEPKYYITQNGSEILDSDGNVINNKDINLYWRKRINSEVLWFNRFYNQGLKIAFYQKGLVYTYRNSNIPDLIDIPIEIDRFSQIPKKEGLSKIKVYGKDAHTLDIFKRYLQRYYRYIDVSKVSSNSIDITYKLSKDKAVKLLSQQIGIDLENSAAFGYGENDINLMKLIRLNGGLAISTEDSNKDVKTQSSYITKGLDSDGFAFAVDTIIGNNKVLRAEDAFIEE